MRSCENCHYCKEGFDYDDFGNIIDYFKCGITDELIDGSEAESCKDYVDSD